MGETPVPMFEGRVLLIDAQLPAALARRLDRQGHPSLHVNDIGLATADDRTIWKLAQSKSWVIVSKDDDFQDLAIRLGSPPQLVWVRLGNCRKDALFGTFDRVMDSIVAALDLGESIVELRG